MPSAQQLPQVPPKPFGYYMGRANLHDSSGKMARRMMENAKAQCGESWLKQFETLKQAANLKPGDPEQRRIGYSQRKNATIPFVILDPATGQPQMAPTVDQSTGQIPVDEKGQPVMQPVTEMRPTWQVLKDTFPKDYMRQAKDAVKLGADVPAWVAYDVQEAERGN